MIKYRKEVINITQNIIRVYRSNTQYVVKLNNTNKIKGNRKLKLPRK